MARDHRWTKGYREGPGRQTWVQKEGWIGRGEHKREGTRRNRWLWGEGELATHGLELDIRDGLEGGRWGN